MAKNKIFKPNYRIRKAYSITFKVMMSYSWLYLKSKIFGQQYFEKNLQKLHLKNAERVKNSILHLQGLFIKVGQLLSILSNFLPEAFQEPLQALQNKLPYRPYEEIEQQIQKELEKSTSELFAFFDKEPLASASIGQVHKATLKTGENVVVKIQHQHIEAIAAVDLKVMERIVAMIAFLFDIKGIEHAYTQVKKMMEEELDFEQEAVSMQLIAQNLKQQNQVLIPKVFTQFSNKRILVTEFCEGVKISEVQQINEWNIDRKALANRLVHAYCKMVFEDGLYHADPHPGNILVQENGTIVFLDFGAVASLKPSMRTGFLALIDAAVKNDNEKIISALNSMDFLTKHKDTEKTAEQIIDALREFMQNEVQFDGLNFKDIKVNPFETSIINLIKEVGVKGIAKTVQVPKEFVLLNRMLTLLLGICNTLDSQVNPLDEIQPYLKKYILGEQGNFVQFVADLLKGNVVNALALPNEIHKTLKKAQKGELAVKIEGFEQRNRLIYALGQQFILSIFLIATLVFAYLFYKENETNLFNYLLYFGGFILFLLLKSLWRNRRFGK